MSTVVPVRVGCRRCGGEVAGDVVVLGNLDRRGDFEGRVLEGRYNVLRCESCGHRTTVGRASGLVSFERQLWLYVYPAWAERHWRDLGLAADRAFARNLNATPHYLRGDLDRWKIRAVFGHDALREKLVIWRAGLDELDVESAKLAIVAAELLARAAGGPEVVQATRVWLWEVTADELRWVIARPTGVERHATSHEVLRAALPEGFLREELRADAFVDHRRWIVPPVPANPLDFDLNGQHDLAGGGAAIRAPHVEDRGSATDAAETD